MAKFFITVRSVTANAFGDNLGAIRYLVVPDGDIPAPAHAVKQSAWIKQIMATFPVDANGVPNGNLLFVVHGYNLAVAGVDAQQRNVKAGLADKLACTIVSFDWPSWAETFAYLPQLDVAKKTAIDLVNAGVRPMLAAQKKDCRVAIHILCHSMGAYVVREALDHADDGLETGTDWMVNQLVMIAGDVDAADFVAGNKDTESMLGHAYRITNFQPLRRGAASFQRQARRRCRPRRPYRAARKRAAKYRQRRLLAPLRDHSPARRQSACTSIVVSRLVFYRSELLQRLRRNAARRGRSSRHCRPQPRSRTNPRP
jgi:pimeloyl-ACP methyl ester carboxylesterase